MKFSHNIFIKDAAEKARKQLDELRPFDSAIIDEQNLEKSMEMPTPWFSGLSESIRNETVRNYFDMTCELCTTNVYFQSDTDARLHYLKIHQKMGYIRCCGKRYFDKINIYNHIEYHKHPEHFK